MTNTGSFRRLVSDLTPAERKELLEKMQSVPADTEADSLPPADITTDAPAPLAVQIKNESIFVRFWLWLRALFANSTMEALFNEDRIAQIARSIEKIAPGMIDAKRNFLLTPFRDALTELKASLHFFRPYIEPLDENLGDFYILLGSIVMPDVEAVIDSEVDPYSQPLTPDFHPEQRTTFLRRLDSVMQEISSDSKANMYIAARAANWLVQFSRLPLTRMLSHFNAVLEDASRCTFAPIEADLCQLAKVMSESLPIPDEVLEALYLYSGRITPDSINDGQTTEESSAEHFMERAHTVVASIRTFMHKVPLRSITRVVLNDAQWYPESLTGGEEWFIQYKTSWKKLFERKWESWILDCKKEALRESLEKDFALTAFPLLPERPWAMLWGGVPFRYELTAGFLYWYFRECFPSFELTLKTIMLEGDFIQKSNRQEYTEAFNDLIQVSISLDVLHRKLKSGGEFDIIFARLINEKTRTLQGQSRAEELMKEAESDVASIIYKFGESCRRIDMVLNGILQVDKVDSRYDSITNFSEIQGTNNGKFIKHLAEAKLSLKNAYELVVELEPLDSPTMLR